MIYIDEATTIDMLAKTYPVLSLFQWRIKSSKNVISSYIRNGRYLKKKAKWKNNRSYEKSESIISLFKNIFKIKSVWYPFKVYL